MMEPFAQYVYLSSTLLLAGGLGVVSYAILRGLRQRDLMLALSMVVFLGALALRIPVQPDAASGFERVLLAAVDALRYFALGVPFEPVRKIGNTLLALWYRYLDVGISFVAPLCTTMILLSLLQMLGWVRFRLCFWRPVYCFSELNERSFALASSVMQDWNAGEGDFFKPVLVFFKTEPHDDSVELQYRAEAQRLGAAFYREPIHAVRLPDPWFRRVKVFLIDQDEDANMGTATRMKDWIAPNRKRLFPGHYTDSDLLVFSTRESSEVVFDKLLEEVYRRREALLGKDEAKKEDARIDLHLINETKLIAQKLLWEQPLYEAVDNTENRKISMLLVGGGRLGMEILRTALVCGVMNACTFQVTVVDANGRELRRQFRHAYGELPESIRNAIHFRQADVYSTDFDKLLNNPKLEPNYIVVATGDDERNVTTAQFLQRYYARRTIQAGELIRNLRRIHVAIRDQGRYEALETLQNDGLVLFGCHSEVFCRKMLLDRPIDRVAMMFHNAYKNQSKTVDPTALLSRVQSNFLWNLNRMLNWWDHPKRAAKHQYYTLSAVKLHSNQMAVMHSIYKFRDLMYQNSKLEAYQELMKNAPERAFAMLVALVSGNIDQLCRLEHRRWEVFQALDGWQPFPIEHLQKFGEEQQKLNGEYWNDLTQKAEIPPEKQLAGLDMHRHMTARLHACMTPYDNLKGLAEQINNWFSPEDKKEFIENDKLMCVNSLFAWIELVPDWSKTMDLRTKLWGTAKRLLRSCEKITAEPLLAALREDFVPPEAQTDSNAKEECARNAENGQKPETQQKTEEKQESGTG